MAPTAAGFAQRRVQIFSVFFLFYFFLIFFFPVLLPSSFLLLTPTFNLEISASFLLSFSSSLSFCSYSCSLSSPSSPHTLTILPNSSTSSSSSHSLPLPCPMEARKDPRKFSPDAFKAFVINSLVGACYWINFKWGSNPIMGGGTSRGSMGRLPQRGLAIS